MTNILATNNPILIKLLSLDSSYIENSSIFIKFELLNAEIFLILHFYYKLSHWSIGFGKIEVRSSEIHSIRHLIISKSGLSGLGMNGLRIIRMKSADYIGLNR